MRMTRVYVYLLLLTLIFVFATTKSADGDTIAGEVNKKPVMVNIELKDIGVKEAIDAIFKGTNYKYEIEPGVSGRVKEIVLKGITFEDALKAFVNAAGLEYKIVDDVYIIGPASEEKTKTSSAETSTTANTSSAASGAGPANDQVTPESSNALQPDMIVPPENQAFVEGAPGPTYYGYPIPYYSPYGYYPPQIYNITPGIQILRSRGPVVIIGPEPGAPQRRVSPRPPGWNIPRAPDLIRQPQPLMPWEFYGNNYGWQ